MNEDKEIEFWSKYQNMKKMTEAFRRRPVIRYIIYWQNEIGEGSFICRACGIKSAVRMFNNFKQPDMQVHKIKMDKVEISENIMRMVINGEL